MFQSLESKIFSETETTMGGILRSPATGPFREERAGTTGTAAHPPRFFRLQQEPGGGGDHSGHSGHGREAQDRRRSPAGVRGAGSEGLAGGERLGRALRAAGVPGGPGAAVGRQVLHGRVVPGADLLRGETRAGERGESTRGDALGPVEVVVRDEGAARALVGGRTRCATVILGKGALVGVVQTHRIVVAGADVRSGETGTGVRGEGPGLDAGCLLLLS